jgi:hypothetical protein
VERIQLILSVEDMRELKIGVAEMPRHEVAVESSLGLESVSDFRNR